MIKFLEKILPSSKTKYPKDLRKHFRKFLNEIHDQRSNYPNGYTKVRVSETGETESLIVVIEQDLLFAEINRLRLLKNKPLVPKSKVIFADKMATGHADFAEKLVTYAVWIVLY